jgi:hypothetical protein
MIPLRVVSNPLDAAGSTIWICGLTFTAESSRAARARILELVVSRFRHALLATSRGWGATAPWFSLALDERITNAFAPPAASHARLR